MHMTSYLMLMQAAVHVPETAATPFEAGGH